MAKVGYIRISTTEQNTTRQETALSDCDPVFIDRCSGKNTKRPELQKMLSYVRAGDTLKVESFSRLARNTADLLEIVDFLQKKDVQLVSIKENIDTSTPAGKLMLTFFAGLSEFEREQMLERQREGIQAAKQTDAERIANGLPPVKYRGRKRIDTDKDDFRREYRRWKAGKQTGAQTMRNLGLKPSTFYRRVKEYETQKDRK